MARAARWREQAGVRGEGFGEVGEIPGVDGAVGES